MDFHLKQWRDESEEEQQETSMAAPPPSKLQRLAPASSPALPLFLSQPTTPYSSDHSASKFPRMGSHFSLSQWQELELQALIFRHMIAGAAVPPELLHLVRKSLIAYPSSPYHHYYPHYQPALVQSGYWGRGAMDPEPGRCRRTDGKKWRCSRDVVAGNKYCERHMHRGRNRSRKPVEIPTSTSTASSSAHNTNQSNTRQGVGGGGGGGGGGSLSHFSFAAPPPRSSDHLHLNHRATDSITEAKESGKTLRHFFDDWPKPLQETDDAANAMASATNLSISIIPQNPTSDFSLKLGTGNEDEASARVLNGERDKPQVINWGMSWGTNSTAPMGGPLAEALRSSTSSSSPTSVLHRVSRGLASEATSYVISS